MIRIVLLVLIATSIVFAQPNGIITGTVTDATTRLPLPHVLVSAANGARDVTGADGSFRLPDLPSGDLKIHIAATGYRALEQTVHLSDGEHVGTLFEMHPMARIMGRIVDKETGAGLLRDVQCAKVGPTPDRFQPEPVFTNPDGTFRVDSLEPGDYRITVNSEGSATLAPSLSEKPKSQLVYGPYVYPEKIHVAEGEQRTVEIRIAQTESRSVSVSLEYPRGSETLASRIVYGTSAGDDLVQLRDLGTRPAGPFRIDGLIPGSYRIYVAAGKDTNTAYGTAAVIVGDRDPDELHIKLAPGVSVTGGIRMLEEHASLPAKAPNLAAFLNPTDGSWLAIFGQSMDVQASHFHTDGVAQGEYNAELAGLPDGYAVSAVLFDGADTHGGPVSLYGPSEITFVVTSKPATILGSVRDANQNPLVNALVQLQHEPAFATGPVSQFVTDATGEFRFRNLAPGRYTIAGAQPIELKPGETATIAVTR